MRWKPNTMFGWRDYKEDGKQLVENGVENSVFHCLGSKGKKRGRKTREKIFLPGPPIFFLPNREENYGEKTALTMELHKCLLPPTLLTNTMAILESSKKKKKKKNVNDIKYQALAQENFVRINLVRIFNEANVNC